MWKREVQEIRTHQASLDMKPGEYSVNLEFQVVHP